DVVFTADAAGTLLRHRGAGCDHSSRADRGKHGPSLLKATPGPREGDLSTSVARTGAGAHARCPALSGAIAADGHDRRRFHGRTGRRVTPRVRVQALRKKNERGGGAAAHRDGAERDYRRSSGSNYPFHHVVRTLRIPGI